MSASRLHSLFLTGILTLGLVGLTLLPARAEEISRDQQISDLERQIAELNKKLEVLRKTPAPAPAPKPEEPALPAGWVSALGWRCVGPASMGGRIVALSVLDSDPSTFWIATASGGLLKTTNNGTTFEHQFDREATVSVGDVCVAPSNKEIVWVGTGENNPRNSVSYGDGVYKSTDGGKTWKNMGLKGTYQIGRVIVHPKNPDIVYVGALGRLYGPNEERGLFKTEDGGTTWKKILYIDNQTGVIDMQMHPKEPDTLLVATWDRLRDGFDSHSGALAGQLFPGVKVEPPLADGYDAYDPIRKWGKGGGIHKTTDGGKTFKKLTKGLPTCALGRIGLDYYRKDPNVVFAIIDSEKTGTGRPGAFLGVTGENAPNGTGAKLGEVTADGPAGKAGLKAGDVISAVEKKPIKVWEDLTEQLAARKPGDKLSVTVTREGKPVDIVVTLGERPAAPAPGGGGGPGGGGPGGGGRGRLVDLTPADPRGDLKVAAVTKEGAFDKAGLKADDVIAAVAGAKVTTWREFSQAVAGKAAGETYKLTVLRGKDSKELTVTAVAPPPATRATPTRPYGSYYGGQRENVQTLQGPEGVETGGVYRSADGGESWTRVNSLNPRPMYFSQIRVDPTDEQKLYVLGIRMHVSTDGGKKFAAGADSGVHPDHHALWIDPRDGRHMIVGGDGGTYTSYDRGATWDYLNITAIGQFYHVCVDSRKPYRVYGGMQDNGSWGGPSRAQDGRGPVNTDWVLVNGGDGFICRVDPVDPDIVYFESQDGNIGRRNLRTGERAGIKPRNVPGQAPYHFNWNTPFIVSSHAPSTVYCAGNHVFRSTRRGDDFRVISPDLTRTGQASATALAESPRNPDVLWVGTDDGNLWVTRDGGAKWTNVIEKVGLPKPFCVSTIDPSRFAEGRAYVAFDAHRSDDDNPHVFVTEDFGQTWKSVRGNLPVGSSRVLREDLTAEDVLYLGTEFAVWASIDRGKTWTRINGNLPTVAVHELAQHPTAGEMVAATHGRSLWVLDVTPLRQMSAASRKADAALYRPNAVTRYRTDPQRGTIYGTGAKNYFGQNPERGASIYYSLAKKADSPKLTIQDVTGKTLATLTVKNEPGLHRVAWDLQGPAGPRPQGVMALVPVRQQAPVPAGQYRVVLSVVEGTTRKEFTQALTVENDPSLPAGTTLAEEVDVPRKKREVWQD